ncbi:hypothetical protein [Variovorax sp. OK605]|uniref:hypothetical protein n=1 Tax=Variovorax sp. OK605 TaxID=1855317 RepID=UPI0015A665A9|nr:hypothetical protein [Variovorax sp. OK605]
MTMRTAIMTTMVMTLITATTTDLRAAKKKKHKSKAAIEGRCCWGDGVSGVVREALVSSRAHRAGQAALEHAVDVFHLAACGGFAVDGAQRHHHVLSQVPEGFDIGGEAHALADTLHRMTGMGLKHRQHCGTDAPQLALCGAAGSEPGHVQQTKNAAEEHETKSVLRESQDEPYLKPQFTIAQDPEQCFLFVNNTLYLVS